MNDPELKEGAVLFDAGRFWDAHEAWERVWKRLPKGSDERRFYQGLILLAAAFLHRDRARTAPERSTRPALRCYRSAMEKLEGLPDETLGLDLAGHRRAAAGCFAPLAEGGDASEWPPAPALRL
jgi:predicted metal-dependent hydrolase